MEIIEHPPIFRLPGIPDHVTYTWLVLVILSGVAFVASRNLQLVPRGASRRSGARGWRRPCAA